MKTCTTCGLDKDLSEFNKNKTKRDGLQGHCRPCGQAKFKKYYQDNKEHHRQVIMAKTAARRLQARDYIISYLKKNPCLDCGSQDIRVLEFDHRPEDTKVNGVAFLATAGYSLQVIIDEIAKCDVRCRNCHTIKTYERMGGSWHDKYLELL